VTKITKNALKRILNLSSYYVSCVISIGVSNNNVLTPKGTEIPPPPSSGHIGHQILEYGIRHGNCPGTTSCNRVHNHETVSTLLAFATPRQQW
jgi:hypothetical protein